MVYLWYIYGKWRKWRKQRELIFADQLKIPITYGKVALKLL